MTHPNSDSDHKLTYTNENRQRRLTQFISFFVGGFLIILGLCGILFPGFAGLHMSSAYSIIISTSGTILFYYSYKKNSLNAFRSCFGFSLFFSLHALAGFIFGKPGVPSLGYGAADKRLLVLVPGLQELGSVDHILNAILGFALMGGAIDWWIKYSSEKNNTKSKVRAPSKAV